ncbi:helix-turn-helix domain-containing protein [Apilactobacillus timberlakei]|uniref:helix-turn-helix domain-containing protein n=1 Tax=Apilactobacillus timberlakei TaxID=2008380 RepID=UPI00112B743F|nr:helix-turn-helix transcriptional regulator [Apilactobacillus timberlakei]TPR18112.1 XRE family transcriptional regulator [Apilactobacillus timberlakei]TPR24881.1 XRE family transcriptional regulator [Apilactobacillus timberlakei]
MSLGERLKNLRDDKEISIQELATNTKISANKIYNFEINNEKPNIFQLDKLAQFYKVSLSDIVNKEEVEKELKIRSWIANLLFIPAIFSFEFMNKNIYISIFIIAIMYVIGFYSTHFGKMTKIMEQIHFENPLVSIIKKYLNRRRSYIISFTIFALGIIMAIINYKTSFGFGILIALFGFFCVLASLMVWDSNKS